MSRTLHHVWQLLFGIVLRNSLTVSNMSRHIDVSLSQGEWPFLFHTPWSLDWCKQVHCGANLRPVTLIPGSCVYDVEGSSSTLLLQLFTIEYTVPPKPPAPPLQWLSGACWEGAPGEGAGGSVFQGWLLCPTPTDVSGECQALLNVSLTPQQMKPFSAIFVAESERERGGGRHNWVSYSRWQTAGWIVACEILATETGHP